MSRSMYCFLTGSMMFMLALPASAANIFCTVTGAKQGTFTGDSATHGGASQIEVFALTQEVKVPFDATSGQIAGKRQHSPVTILKELDRSSPQFFAASVTNEVLRSVVCNMFHTTGTGLNRAYYKIELTNATIVEVKDSGDGVNGPAQGDEHERISFAYQKITLTDLDSGVTSTDDWQELE